MFGLVWLVVRNEQKLTAMILIADAGKQAMCAELPHIHLLFFIITIIDFNVHMPCFVMLIT